MWSKISRSRILSHTWDIQGSTQSLLIQMKNPITYSCVDATILSNLIVLVRISHLLLMQKKSVTCEKVGP